MKLNWKKEELEVMGYSIYGIIFGLANPNADGDQVYAPRKFAKQAVAQIPVHQTSLYNFSSSSK